MKIAKKLYLVLAALFIALLMFTSCNENPVILNPIFKNDELFVFPNPLSTQGIIRFSLNKNSHIKVFIIDSQGRLISTLIDDMIMWGDNMISFETSKIPPGAYYVVAEAGDESISKGFIVRK